MYTALFHTHRLVVSIFVALYLIKMILLLMNKRGQLDMFRKWTKVPEMIISTLFLVTGVWMLIINQEVTSMQYFKFVAIIAAIPCGVIGFSKGNKLLGVLSFVLIVGAYGLAEMGKRKVIKIDLTPGVVTDANEMDYDQLKHGEALYSAYCVSCHGEDGRRGVQGAKDLTVSTLGTTENLDIIMNGRLQMPAFRNVLNQRDAEAVEAYIQTLRTE